MQKILDRGIEFLKGVGPQKADALKLDLGIYTFKDLLLHFPFRHIDKTKFHDIRSIATDGETVQIRGILRNLEMKGEGRAKRLVGTLRDSSGSIDLVWFQSAQWIQRSLAVNREYIAYGRVTEFGRRFNMTHPDMELVTSETGERARTFDPVYPSTEKLKKKNLDAAGIRRLMRTLFDLLSESDIPENLPDYLIEHFKIENRYSALQKIHFPENQDDIDTATRRLKFEELFLLQLRLLQVKGGRKEISKGFYFSKIGDYFNDFFHNVLPFELTGAQKRVIKEIRIDVASGRQMNRLVQGDVGSGKTMVAQMCMLMALDNDFQACLMAPTEILAQQHFEGMSESLAKVGVHVDFLSGSIKGKKKRGAILEKLASGETQVLIGTHALIEDWVEFQNLGLVIIDEQHRFGVEQRAKLYLKNKAGIPHVLIMTATPIPRTLAMTVYGDLDVSVIDELPPGRKPVTTIHKTEAHRLRVFGMLREEIAKGRQAYIVYPMIEETEKMDLNNLMSGYESVSREFPIPDYQISVVHGKMKAKDKDFEMQRFIKGETHIMIATTVIEVGVNVPNASIMVIENSERFGLSQLHQLRGRVGRGADQSYCILLTSVKLSADGKERVKTMVSTTDGFKIADADLKLRGPGNIQGKAQSGMINFRIADLGADGRILQAARDMAMKILDVDPRLLAPEHKALKEFMDAEKSETHFWGRIS